MTKWRSWDDKHEIDPNGLIETKTLEVENIAEETTPKDLHRLFSKYGVVLSVAIEAGYESKFLAVRDPESEEATEAERVIGADRVVGRVTMLTDHASVADRKLHGRRWRGQKLKLTVKRDPWGSVLNFEE